MTTDYRSDIAEWVGQHGVSPLVTVKGPRVHVRLTDADLDKLASCLPDGTDVSDFMWCASPKLRMIGSASIGNERQFTYVWRDHERSREVLKKERVLKWELVRRKTEADHVLFEATRTFRVQCNETKRAAQERFDAAMDELLQAAPPTD